MSISPSGQTAEGKGIEPSSQVQGTALAKRRGKPYPPTFHLIQWTHRESNPPCLLGTGPACRTGDFPLDDEPIVLSVNRRGIEPRFPACGAGVVPLDQQPVSFEWT